MMSVSRIPSASSMFQAYASMSTSITLFKTMLNQVVPRQLQQYIIFKIHSYFRPRSSDITLVIERLDVKINEIYFAAEIYLSAKTSPDIRRLIVNKNPKKPNVNVKFGSCGKISDSFEGIELVWRFVHEAGEKSNKHYFELSFNKQHKDKILKCYIPYVLDQANIITNQKKIIKLYSLSSLGTLTSIFWDSVRLEHPSTFETLALEPRLKKDIIEDLDRFLRRKEFYKRVGKAWKRGYLLYGPPGTGKSSLIAAIANHLKFDIYDLDFSNVHSDYHLRNVLLRTKNRSIIVVEDIDCSIEFQDRTRDNNDYHDQKVTLAGFLNVIDGLCSSCGDERVIIFTTNHKEKLDPALLRPGRMDKHIHMSYLTVEGFKILAANYLEIHDHNCFQEICKLIESVQVTPAEVAEELMKNGDADICLDNVVNLLKWKRRINEEEIQGNDSDMDVELQRTFSSSNRRQL